MKRIIKADYIPDMTERYPEGEYPVYEEDDWDGPSETLREAIETYIPDAANGDWYNKVTILKEFDSYYGETDLLYEGNSLEEALKWAERRGYADAPVKNYFWHDADISFTIRR